MDKPIKRNNAFDFLRLFAALAVVIGHTVPFMGLSFFGFSQGEGYFFLHGVPLFFILSGFLIYRSYEKCVERGQPTWHFYMNRVLRIVPAIYVYAIVVTILLLFAGIVVFSNFTEIPFIAWFVSNFALLSVYHPEMFSDFGVGVVNGSLWTIPAEFSFYLVVPLLFMLERKLKLKKMIIVLFVIAFFSGLLGAWSESLPVESLVAKFYKVSFLPLFLFFVLGIFLSKVWHKTPKKFSLFVLSIVTFLFVDAYLIKQFDNYLVEYLLTIVWAVPLSYAIIYFGYFAPAIFGKITNKIGDLSFGVYIWHMIVINIHPPTIYISFN